MGNIPAIRFEGCTDEWEQRMMGELTAEFTEYSTLSSELPLLTSSRAGLMYQNQYRGSFTTDSKETLFSVVPLGACTYRHMSDDDVFHFNINALEKGLVSREYPVFIASEDNELGFIVQHLNSDPKFRAFCAEQKKGGTRTRLYYKTLCEFSMLVPKSAEQRKISRFLSDMDDLIVLHQHNYEKIAAAKKSMLENLFPQGDAQVPEIRFEGFAGNWVKRPLGELFEEYSEKGHEELPPLTIVQGVGTIPRNESDRRLMYSKANLSGYKMVREGDFIVHLRSFEGGLEIATNTGLISPAYHTFHGKNVDPGFYYAYFRSRRFIDVDLRPHVYGIRDGRSIDISGMKTILIPYTSCEEQKQIAGYLNSLDELIELYRIRVEKLKKMKAACLQRLFV